MVPAAPKQIRVPGGQIHSTVAPHRQAGDNPAFITPDSAIGIVYFLNDLFRYIRFQIAGRVKRAVEVPPKRFSFGHYNNDVVLVRQVLDQHFVGS
jgi:hypothetical protein